jgi:aminopeptidase N
VSGRQSSVLAALALALLVVAAGCETPLPESGVALALAEHRAATITEVEYDLTLGVPEDRTRPIGGQMAVSFSHTGLSEVVLDFVPDTATRVRVNGAEASFRHVNEHLVIPLPPPPPGSASRRDSVVIDFEAGDASLNRNDGYLYALFVPDRARMAVPVFDQPNMKARWLLTLDIPQDWVAVSNGSGKREEHTASGESVARYTFSPTDPISSYLFSFAAGRFEAVTAERDGRPMTMYHRESDAAKVERNAEAIFDLHGKALSWLEDYTGVSYPFEKFDFVLIPSFQFGGMEHPGAVLYRSSSLMLDENPPQGRLLGRASLISHETAHMWFGDLVTMDWFNDVWTKEVFANFMAAKIVRPSFPEVDHDLRFLLAHYPSAYGVDRTPGANPIRQDLQNLNEAGALYGAIIYQKAPIVMRKLESLVGPAAFRGGLQEYLNTFAFGNATWPDLISILDARSDHDLAVWSESWVNEPGRPEIFMRVVEDRLVVAETDTWGAGRTWPQEHIALIGGPDGAPIRAVSGDLLPAGSTFILPNADGIGYGAYRLDRDRLLLLLEEASRLEDPVNRGAAWLTLWEAVLAGDLEPDAFIGSAMDAVATEPVELIRQRVAGNLRTAYWRFLLPDKRLRLAPRLEGVFLAALEGTDAPGERHSHFESWIDVVQSEEGVARLQRIWSGEEAIANLSLSEWDFAQMALELAVRDVRGADSLLAQQVTRMEDPDRKARLEAILPAVASAASERNKFFESLASVENRANESRVLDGVAYLNHPLRARSAEKYLRPALDLALEIQTTGDIFFPTRWLAATLGGHQTASAAAITSAFIDGLPVDYPQKLRGKILQSADGLFGASRLAQN